jgi:hypothetical protein
MHACMHICYAYIRMYVYMNAMCDITHTRTQTSSSSSYVHTHSLAFLEGTHSRLGRDSPIMAIANAAKQDPKLGRKGLEQNPKP